MSVIEGILLFASLAGIALALASALAAFLLRARPMPVDAAEPDRRPGASLLAGDALRMTSSALAIVAFAAVTLAIATRTIETGRGPFSNMYEFAVAFAWGVTLAGMIFHWKYRTAAMQNIGLTVALLLLVFAVVQYSKPAPLVPALQQSALLSAHVACAVVAYGTLTIGFGAAVLVLFQNKKRSAWLPDAATLDNISYHSVLVGFPFLTLLIVLGALWADIAWGSYWSWDPKESASLVTWLIYAGYVHARAIQGWKHNRAAILLVAGFAAILLTFFGNYVFNGLHSYG